MGMFDRFTRKSVLVPVLGPTQGSAFLRHATHEQEIAEAKAKISALDSLTTAASAAISDLEAEVDRVHAAQNTLALLRTALLARL